LRWFLLAVLLGAVVSVPAPAAGQYLKRLDPKTPRLPDGKPEHERAPCRDALTANPI
jgi:hypothetical protein